MMASAILTSAKLDWQGPQLSMAVDRTSSG
jgi:hypothetical protein